MVSSIDTFGTGRGGEPMQPLRHQRLSGDFTNAVTLVFTVLSVAIAGGMLVGMFFKERFFCYFCPPC